MTENYEIQLGKTEFVNATNTDENLYLDLRTTSTEIFPYDESSVINVAQLFNDERQASWTYRVYGCINFMSIINGLKLSYSQLSDFFTRPSLSAEFNDQTRNILNCFDVYLCRPLGNTFSTGGTVIVSGNTKIATDTYRLKYQVLTRLTDFEIYKSGFNKNIYNDQIYSFHFSKDFNIFNQTDSFNKPVTELYLFFNFNPKSGTLGAETVTQNSFVGSTRPTRPYVAYNDGSIIDGDWVFYVPADFQETQIKKTEHYVKFLCNDVPGGTGLSFKYNPFHQIKIREYGDEIISGNISGTSELDAQIPYYAVKIDNNGNYIWKDLLQNGYIDPISNKGVNFPFINKRHYVFTNYVLSMSTDLGDTPTANVFSKIKFGANTLQYNKPSSDLNNLGNKC
jgi:hypothetical protein